MRIFYFLIRFEIRCKVISVSNVRYFRLNKVVDAVVCDNSGEIKVVGFNNQADRLLEYIKFNQVIIIQTKAKYLI